MTWSWLSSNLWKYLLIQFTNRRNTIPILSIYYLTLPNAEARDLGLYTGIGYIAAMIMQIPSGYIADLWWQKNTLILAKVFLIASSILYVVADNFWVFTLGGICMSLGANAFSSGTTSSFLKGTLEKLGRGSEYRVVASKISGNVSLLSIALIVGLPFLTNISIRMPFYVGIGIDFIWLLVALSLFPVHTKIEKHDKKKLLPIFRELRHSGFFPYAIFSAVIGWFLFTDTVYRSPYLLELGYPIAFIGLVMGGSRLVWWFVGRSIRTIEKYISFQLFILTEIFLFPIYYIGVGYITNPWGLGILFSLMVGWFWGRDVLINHIPDPRYRATALSMKAQIDNIVQVITSFSIAWIMGISYALGFQVLGIAMFLLLGGIYIFGVRQSLQSSRFQRPSQKNDNALEPASSPIN